MSAALSMDYLPQLASIVGGKNVLEGEALTLVPRRPAA